MAGGVASSAPAVEWWVWMLAPLLRRFRLLMFLVLFALAVLSSTCERVFGNSSSVDVAHSIYDVGFAATRGWHAYLAQRPAVVDVLSVIATLLCTVYSAVGLFYHCLYRRRYGIALCMFFVLMARATMAACTGLPRSPDYLYSIYDFPNVLTDDFIFLFSGHAANLSLFGHFLWISGHRGAALFVHATQLFQWLFLLSTRGHYTVDLVVGAAVGAYFVTFEPQLTAVITAIEARIAQRVAALDAQLATRAAKKKHR